MRPRIELVLLSVGVSSLHAQGRDVDFLYGRWYQGNQSTSYELRTTTPLGGVFSHGLSAHVLLHDSLGRNYAFYGAGWELQAFRHRRTFGPYAIAGVALGLSTDTSSQDLAALWNLGAGLEWRPISWVGVGMEVRYRLQDVGPRGFWRASSDARDGVNAALTVSLGIGKQAWRSGGGGGGGGQSNRLPPLVIPATGHDHRQCRGRRAQRAGCARHAVRMGWNGGERFRLLRARAVGVRATRHAVAADEPRSGAIRE